MKYIYKILLLSFIIIGITSCDENENFEILAPQGGIAINSPIDGSSIILNDTNDANPALTISWTASAIEGTGATYTVEVATIGTDFAVPHIIGTTENTSISLSVKELNTLALDVLQIEADKEAGIDIRVSVDGEVSQKISILLTPYTVEYPELFLVGSLTGWDPGTSLAMTRLDFNLFEITIDLADDDEFKFLPQNTGWEGDLGEDPANPGTLIEDGEENLKGFAAGKYKITANLNLFTFTAEFIPPPANMYAVGAGLSEAGWGWDTPVVLAQIQDGVFQATTSLVNDTFRFFTVEEDWGSGLNFPYYIGQGYTIDANLEDALDGDNNFRFIGEPGNYTITLDDNNKTIVLSQIPLNIAVPGNHQGWNPAEAPLLAASVLGNTDYEGFVWLDGDFKFIAPDGDGNFNWGNLDWGDASGENGSYTQVLTADGEGNIGAAAGYYLVKADTEALTYSIELTNWGVIGNATPNGWDSDTDMVYDPATQTWSVTLDLTAQTAPDNGIKFRANDGWDLNIGDTDADGTMEFGGSNIGIAEDGNYTITLDLSNPRAYTYSVVKN